MSGSVCVSVIIPVYNTENYLERCIASVIGQSYSSLDIVLVDDGSTDGSTAICRKWEGMDRRITYIRQANAGLGAARNSGIRAAKSDYITFLDADDWFEPTFIEKIIGTMLDTDSDVGLCDIYYVDSISMERQTIKLRFDKPVISSRDDKSAVNKSRLFAWGKIFKRELLNKCGFSFPTIAYEDTCIPVLIACANQICYVPEPLISYFRNRQGSLSNDYSKIGDIEKGLHLLYDKLGELGIYKEYLLEYKKIVLGQLRFACRKWGALDKKSVIHALQGLEQFAGNIFPELQDIAKRKYFAFDDKILAIALDKALPYAKQITGDVSDADCVVVLECNVPLVPQSTVQRIIIPDIDQISTDTVTAQFNIAEQIMEKL